ncbi:MAG: hypothetical protein AAGD07_25900 [Planctomycetota bacterium]
MQRSRYGSLLLIGLLVSSLLAWTWPAAIVGWDPFSLPVAALWGLVGMQNAGLGTALAATLVRPNSSAQIPTAVYAFGCMLTGTILSAFWSRSASRSG